MYKNLTIAMLFCALFLISNSVPAKRYGESLCNNPDYHCIKVKRGQSWEKLWPNPEERDIVKRVNRMNTHIYTGMRLAVPRNLEQLTIYDVAPFPRYIDPPGEKTIYVDQTNLAWGAYDANGQLVWWGPISSGQSYCPDVGDQCTTPTGSFRIFRKQGIDCISTEFPIHPDGSKGGAIMPFCMHFYGGYALHGSEEVPGYRASHGCVRLFIEDAKWLNEEFVDIPGEAANGTRVIIEDVSEDGGEEAENT